MPSAAPQLRTAIAAKARELGLRIGFSRAEAPARMDAYREWLKAGKAGTMSYLARSAERRAEPALILPDVKTVISVSENYFTQPLPEEIRSDPSRGLIASYAWGRDYHDVLLTKLETLAEFIHTLAPDCETKCYVDTGHILERDFGERAGLGFTGKNTLLIAPQGGSYFFLGEILTTLELPPTEKPALPSCGSCTNCLTVCPTHALPAEYILDSNLCISYLTIEYRGVIDRKLRALMGNHVFGCDDCQDCCPWNRFSKETSEKSYTGELDRKAPKLAMLSEMTESEFNAFFAGSPVLRPKYAGMMRNVAIALGNWKDRAALRPLQRLSGSESALVRLHAAWGLSRLDGEEGRKLLTWLRDNDDDEGVRREAREGLRSEG